MHVNEGVRILDSTHLARRVVDLADEKQATDIVLLDLRQVSMLADYFVICTAGSQRQIDAIIDHVLTEAKKEGRLALHVEGEPSSGWILLDFGDVVLHVFAVEQREYYRLEDVWQKAAVVLKLQ